MKLPLKEVEASNLEGVIPSLDLHRVMELEVMSRALYLEVILLTLTSSRV